MLLRINFSIVTPELNTGYIPVSEVATDLIIMPSSFQYSSLGADELRLLEVLPTNRRYPNKIRCRIAHFSESGIPPYRALSYSWSDHTRPSKIRMEILLNESIFLIQSNLWAALKYIRNTEERLFWVDAICINQNDAEERGHQVHRMSQIYAHALSVMIWLGPTADDSDTAIAFIKSISTEKDCTENWLMQTAVNNSQVWQAVDQFFKRPWWSRLWVIQEVALARHMELVCGERCLSWDQLIQFKSVFQKLPPVKFKRIPKKWNDMVGSINIITVQDRAQRATVHGKKKALIWLLAETRYAHATDPHDKIYGILSIAADAHELVPNPTYLTSFQETYQSLVVQYVSHYKCLNIIALGTSMNRLSGLPTWTPNFNVKEHSSHLNKSWDIPDYYASGYSQAITVCSPELRYLTCRGLEVDSVDGVFSCAKEKEHTAASSKKSAYGDKKGTREAIWRTLVLDRSMSLQNTCKAPESMGEIFVTLCAHFERTRRNCTEAESQEKSEYQELYNDYFRIWYRKNRLHKIAGRSIRGWALGLKDDAQPPKTRDTDLIEDYSQAVAHSTRGKRLITTSSGFFGMVPKDTQRHDKVCILYGCDVPVILRPKGRCFQFIGECYIHGIMYGEAMPDTREISAMIGSDVPNESNKAMVNGEAMAYDMDKEPHRLSISAPVSETQNSIDKVSWIILLWKGGTEKLYFHRSAINRDLLLVGDLRRLVAEKLKVDSRRITLIYKDTRMVLDSHPVKAYGLKDCNCKIYCMISDVNVDDDDTEVIRLIFKGEEFRVCAHRFSIRKGLLLLGDLREIASRMFNADLHETQLFLRRRELENDKEPVRNLDNRRIYCMVREKSTRISKLAKKFKERDFKLV